MNSENLADKCFFNNWWVEDGILLLEVNRMLRAGGYFAWAAQPVYKHEEPQMEAWKGSLSLCLHMHTHIQTIVNVTVFYC